MTDIFDQDKNRNQSRVRKAAVILILVGVFFTLASLIYGNENFPMILVMIHINLSTWLIGLGLLMLVSERIYDRKLTERDKRNLVLQLGSPYNRIALEAARQLYALGWHKDGTLEHANLIRANLKGAALDHAYFHEAIFLEADLSGASLVMANFGRANLLDANLQDTDLRYSRFYNARMSSANLKNANLYEADFSHAVVRDEQLAEAQSLYGATMQNGERYDGRFHLKGDLDEAERIGIDIDDSNLMKRWYQGDISVKLRGQPLEPDWFDALEEDELDEFGISNGS